MGASRGGETCDEAAGTVYGVQHPQVAAVAAPKVQPLLLAEHAVVREGLPQDATHGRLRLPVRYGHRALVLFVLNPHP